MKRQWVRRSLEDTVPGSEYPDNWDATDRCVERCGVSSSGESDYNAGCVGPAIGWTPQYCVGSALYQRGTSLYGSRVRPVVVGRTGGRSG